MRRLFSLLVIVVLVSSGCSKNPFGSPAPLRGALYVPPSKATSKTISEILELAESTGIKSLVFDVKDSTGATFIPVKNVALATVAPKADQIDLTTLRRAKAEQGLWLVARVVVMLDGCLLKKRSAWYGKNKNGTIPHVEESSKYCPRAGFLSPYEKKNWEYVAAIAREAARSGFDEIQLDYVRFADDEKLLYSSKLKTDKRSRTKVIADGIALVRKNVPSTTPLSADLFGRVVLGPDQIIGQDAALFAPHLQILSPMLYPYHWGAGDLGVKNPNKMPYQTIKESIRELKKLKLPNSVAVKPWLQYGDWPGKYYGAAELRAQLDALRSEGIREFLIWQASGEYSANEIKTALGK